VEDFKMTLELSKQFFVALSHAVSDILGAENDLAKVARFGAENADPMAFTRVQDQLALLPDETRENILRLVHKRMATDVEAICGKLSNTKPRARAN